MKPIHTHTEVFQNYSFKTVNLKEYEEIFEFINDDNNIIKSQSVVHATLLLNIALNHLDKIPNRINHEIHILEGDFLLSQFYKLLSYNGNISELNQLMALSQEVQIEKSKKPECIRKETLFKPMLYLIHNKYVRYELDDLLNNYMEQLQIEGE